MPRAKDGTLAREPAEKTLKERWIDLLEEIDSEIPADVTEEEIERDIEEAIEAVRRKRRARRP